MTDLIDPEEVFASGGDNPPPGLVRALGKDVLLHDLIPPKKPTQVHGEIPLGEPEECVLMKEHALERAVLDAVRACYKVSGDIMLPTVEKGDSAGWTAIFEEYGEALEKQHVAARAYLKFMEEKDAQ